MQKTISKKVLFLVQSAAIAAIYTVLTYVAASMNLAYNAVQFRFSEALTILPVFTPAAIPGLTLGCFLSNLASPLGPIDWICGTAATFLAATAGYLARDVRIHGIPVASALCPVLANALIIGLELGWLAVPGGGMDLTAFVSGALSVGAGELVVVAVLGLPLAAALDRTGASRRIFSCY